MWRLLPLLLIQLFSFSCGILIDGDNINGANREFETTDPIFLSYIASFESDAKVLSQNQSFEVYNIPINFGNTRQDEFDGVCIKYPNGEREILIKKSWWEYSSTKQKEILIYHELGHCKLNKPHDLQTVNSTKVSIMNPVIPDEVSYANFRLQYLTELFTGNKQGIIDALTL